MTNIRTKRRKEGFEFPSIPAISSNHIISFSSISFCCCCLLLIILGAGFGIGIFGFLKKKKVPTPSFPMTPSYNPTGYNPPLY